MYQRKSLYGVLIAGLLLISLFGAGCTSQPTGEGTPGATPTTGCDGTRGGELHPQRDA
ncbi:hypothetical protein [Methanoculleus sp.]|uniref:hypothetical protein n=1 Tax=Methanoculleus sp. TaxID=90427 RepID=UPI00262F707B|nr:hypothetical protein [Methanoculleus sp.]MDI6866865.1 hypothetical protein [Methanoculleus sp.]